MTGKKFFTKKFLLFSAALLVGGFFVVSYVFAVAGVSITPATNGDNISIDTTADEGTGAFVSLDGPAITETAAGDIAAGTHTLTLPAGWEFDASTINIFKFGGNIALADNSIPVFQGDTSFSFTVSTASTNISTLGFANLKVRPTTQTPSTGIIKHSGAPISGVVDDTSSFGTLTTVAGTVDKLAFTTQPGNAVYGSLLNPQPVVKTQDQFSNNSTNGLASSLNVALTKSAGTGTLVGAANVDIGTAAGNGTATFADITINMFGTGKQLTAAATGLTPAVSGDFEITKKTLTATLTANDKVYNGDASAVFSAPILVGVEFGDALTLSGGSATFANANAGVGKVVTATGLVLNGENKDNYSFDSTATGQADITPLAVTVTPIADQTKIYGDSDPVFNYTYLPALIGSDTFSGALSRAEGQNVAAYNYTIGTLTAGNNYTLVLNPGTFAITKKNLTVNAAGINKEYNGNANATVTLSSTDEISGDNLGYVYTGASYSDKIAASGKTVNVSGISISGAKSSNYNLLNTEAVATANITKKPVTATINLNNKTYDGDTSAIYSSSNPHVVLNGLIPGDIVTATDGLKSYLDKHVGVNKTVNATGITLGGADADNYSFDGTGTGVSTINQRAITVTASTNTKTYNGTTNSAAAPTITAGVLQDGDTANFTQVYDTKDVGTGKTLIPSGTVNDGYSGNNYAVTFVNNLTGEISKAPLSITAENKSKIYGSANPELSASYSGFVNGETSTVLTTPVSLSTAATITSLIGEYSITAAGATSDNYSITFNPGTLTVNQAPLTITADAKTKVYGDADPALTYQITSGTLIGSDTLSGSLARAAGTNVGAYAIASTLANSNYDITFNSANLTITARPITVTAATNTKVYNRNTTAAATPSITAGVLQGGDTANFAESYDNVNVGTGKTLTPSGLVNDGNSGNNYAVTFVNDTTGEITAAAITITADAKTKVYGSADPSLTYQITSGALINGDDLTGSLTRTSGANVGAYAIASTLANSNYNITFVPANLTITKAPLIISAVSTSKIYGSDLPIFNASYSGLVNNDTPAALTVPVSLTTTALASSAVGSYPINAADATAANYDITFAAGTLAVTPAPLTVTADSFSKERGTADPALTYTNSALVNGDTSAVFSGSLVRAAGEGVGAFAINQGTVSAGANYAITYTAGTLTINDTIVPTITSVSINSNNANSSVLAKVGDVITLLLVTDENIQSPTVLIAGQNATITAGADAQHWIASYQMASGDTEGAVAFSISFRDLAGNNGTVRTTATDSSSVTFDRTAPAVAITAPLVATQVNGDAAISFTDDNLNAPKCSVDNSHWYNCLSNTTKLSDLSEFAGLAQGGFTLYLKDTDPTGNIGTANQTSLIKDTDAPTAQLSGAPAVLVNVTIADITVGGTGVVYYKYRLDGGEYGAETAVANHISLAALSDGAHTIYVIGRDQAGNWQAQGSATTNAWTVDTAAPVISGLSTTPNTGTAKVGDTITLNISANAAGYTAENITVNGVDVTASNFRSTGGSNYAADYVIAEGNADVAGGALAASVRLRDAAGNINDAYTTLPENTLAIDANKPVITSIISDATAAGWLKIGDAISFTLTPQSAEAEATVTGSYNGVALAWSTANGGVTYTATYTVTEGDTDKTSALQISGVTIRDAAGNLSSSANGSDIAKTIDANTPDLTLNSMFTGQTLTGGNVYPIGWTAEDSQLSNSSVNVQYSTNGGATWNTVTLGTNNDGTEDWIVPSENTSNGKVRVTVTDLAGNTTNDISSTFSITYSVVTDSTAPVATLNSPNGGETWENNAAHLITWTATDNITAAASIDIKLEYSTDGGTNWTTIETDTPNDGAYSWTPTDVSSSNVLVKVTATDGASLTGSDISNTALAIAAPVSYPASICTGSGPYTCTISLSSGWNLISFPVIPSNSAIATVLSGVSGSGTVTMVKYYDSTESDDWKSYVPGSGGDLTTMDDGKGYWVSVSGTDLTANLVVTGTAVSSEPNPPSTYGVISGWNLIGYKSISAYQNSSAYLSTIPSGYIVFDQNNTNKTSSYLQQGKGYWLWSTGTGSIVPND